MRCAPSSISIVVADVLSSRYTHGPNVVVYNAYAPCRNARCWHITQPRPNSLAVLLCCSDNASSTGAKITTNVQHPLATPVFFAYGVCGFPSELQDTTQYTSQSKHRLALTLVPMASPYCHSDERRDIITLELACGWTNSDTRSSEEQASAMHRYTHLL